MSFLFFIIFTWYDISNINMFPIYLSIATKEVGGREKGELRSSKDSIENKLSRNSTQSMSFLFFIIFTWHDIKDINIFPICLSFATKEVGGEEATPC